MTTSQPYTAHQADAVHCETLLQAEPTSLPGAQFYPYDSETLTQLTGILDTCPANGPVPAGQMLLNFLEEKRRENVCVHLWGPSGDQLSTFLRTDIAENQGLLIHQILVFSSGTEYRGGIFLGYQNGALNLTSNT